MQQQRHEQQPTDRRQCNETNSQTKSKKIFASRNTLPRRPRKPQPTRHDADAPIPLACSSFCMAVWRISCSRPVGLILLSTLQPVRSTQCLLWYSDLWSRPVYSHLNGLRQRTPARPSSEKLRLMIGVTSYQQRTTNSQTSHTISRNYSNRAGAIFSSTQLRNISNSPWHYGRAPSSPSTSL